MWSFITLTLSCLQGLKVKFKQGNTEDLQNEKSK